MKFNKYPYVKRHFIEVLFMDWIAPIIVGSFLLTFIVLLVF